LGVLAVGALFERASLARVLATIAYNNCTSPEVGRVLGGVGSLVGCRLAGGAILDLEIKVSK